jgi:hypothetical protein
MDKYHPWVDVHEKYDREPNDPKRLRASLTISNIDYQMAGSYYLYVNGHSRSIQLEVKGRLYFNFQLWNVKKGIINVSIRQLELHIFINKLY